MKGLQFPMVRASLSWLVSHAADVAAELRAVAASRAVRTAMLWLWPYAGVIVGLDLAAIYGDATGAALPAQFFISHDHSFGEFLEYGLTTSCAVMLFVMWRRLGATAYLANAAMMLWLTLDNVMEFHETFGHWAAPGIPLPVGSPVAANDVGELLFFGLLGGFWLIGLASALLSAQRRAAAHSLLIAAGIGCAAVFGVAVDLSALGAHTLAALEFQTWLEDGGEFAFINLTFLMVVAFYDAEKRRWRARRGEALEAQLV